MRQPVRIGDIAIAHEKRAFGRLDEPMDVVEALRLFDAESIEQRQQDQRGDALGRRRRVEQGAGAHRDRERLVHNSAIVRKIGAAHWAADRGKIRGDLPCHIAAVEIVQAGMSEMVERGR
jgi:hypothetical protein